MENSSDKGFSNFPKPLISFSSKKITLLVLGVIAGLIILYILLFSAPSNFPKGVIFSIDTGSSLRAVSLKLKNKDIIRSRLAFEVFLIAYGGEKHVVSKDYLFETGLPVFEVARRIQKGESHLAPIKVVIPEGFDNKEIADAFASKISTLNKNKFLTLAAGKQGHLFPDTYFFFSTPTDADAIKSLENNFDKKVGPILPQIAKSGHSEKEILTMASIIEEEAKVDNRHNDRAFISGVLWKRLSIGMSLEVDSAPETYKTKGLPQSPINNPGLLAIDAAINPISSPYLYYLHDKTGNIHFAKTFAEHKANELKYLK